MTKVKRKGLVLVAALGVFAALWCVRRARSPAPTPPPVTVRLANRTVALAGFPSADSTAQLPSVRGTRPYLVASRIPVEEPLRRTLTAAGARVIGVLARAAFIVEADASVLRTLADDARFAGACEFTPADKLSPRLQARLAAGAEEVEATVVTLSDEDREAVIALVARLGGELLEGCVNGPDTLRAKLPAASVDALACRGEVRWMEPFSRPKLFNDLAVEPAAMNVRAAWTLHGLTGTNQVVTTSDSGVDTGELATMHRDLAGRVAGIGVVAGCYPYDADGHGTHTAGSIVGDGTMSGGTVRGVAPGAKFWAWACCGKDGNLYVPGSYDQLFRPDERNFPAFIHSASWGDDGVQGEYDESCRGIDSFVWAHPEYLPVFACGNGGRDGAGTIGSPGAAKNLLSVGATQNLRSGTIGGWPSGDPSVTAAYSGRGPCSDGRVKPDLAAPGTGVLSTRAYGCTYPFGLGANTNYAYSCGTSMATPLVAGAAAVVREWLVDRRGFTNAPPTAALMKAVLTGGAKGVSTPDNGQGWGRVDLAETLYPSNRAVKLIDRIPFAHRMEFSYTVETTNAAPFDVQLVWIDYPGESGADRSEPVIVNDLDLTVSARVGGETRVWHGNGGEGRDGLNTAESVRLASAPATVYEITVSCPRITYNHTDGGAAALYIRGAFDPLSAAPEPESVSLSVTVEANGANASVSPAAGVLRVPKGRPLEFSAPEWAYEYSSLNTPMTRRAYVGFTGTGDIPAQGSGRAFTAVLTNDSSVVWRYESEVSDYLYRTIVDLDDGRVHYVSSSTWYPNGYGFSFRLPEDSPLGDPCLDPVTRQRYRLGAGVYALTDDFSGQYLMSDATRGKMWESVEITVDEGIDLWFCYYDETRKTADGLPYWWYLRYLYGGGQMLHYDGSAAGDPDGDGFANAAEYRDATDPVDDTSFRFVIDEFDRSNLVFTASVKGKLIVEAKSRWTDEWQGVVTNRQGRRPSVTNSIALPLTGDSERYFRVIHDK